MLAHEPGDERRILQAADAVIDALAKKDEGLAAPPGKGVSSHQSIILALGGILLLTVVSVSRDRLPEWFTAVWTISAGVAALCTVFRLWIRVGDWGPLGLMDGAVMLDRFSLFAIGTLCVAVVLGALLLNGYLRREDLDEFVECYRPGERVQDWDMEMAADADGRLLGLRGRMCHDHGSSTPYGIALPYNASSNLVGPYVLPARLEAGA